MVGKNGKKETASNTGMKRFRLKTKTKFYTSNQKEAAFYHA